MADILMIEDSASNAALYEAFLTRDNHSVTVVSNGNEAMTAYETARPDLILLDLLLPDTDGLALLPGLEKLHALPPVIVLTGEGSMRRAVEAMRAGASDFLVKPCSADRLKESVDTTLRNREEARTSKTGSSPASPDKESAHVSGFIGDSPVMRNIFTLIENAAGSNASVFITGESGTGKELCARAIHKASDRRNGPFVALNCAAIPKDLIESEIFGHRKGAFTGAVEDRDGAATLANGGTLFLDELCEMDIALQAKLLRFIQTGTYKPVGDGRDHKTDIRFVCATNRDPLQEITEGRFREDLYYRLYVIPIIMPPLRDRGHDILLLAERFLRDFSSLEGKSFTALGASARPVLASHAWAGNVRELENTIRQAVALNDGTMLEADMLNLRPAVAGAPTPQPLIASDTPTQDHLSQSGDAAPAAATRDEIESLLLRPAHELEMMAINVAIRKFKGNVTQAAKALDMSTSTIYRKVNAFQQKHGIDPGSLWP